MGNIIRNVVREEEEQELRLSVNCGGGRGELGGGAACVPSFQGGEVLKLEGGAVVCRSSLPSHALALR